MSEQNTADNWRLEDTGDTLDQWKLQEAEQTRMAQWQLEGGQPEDVSWQPVAYERQPPRRGSWLLPILVGLALIAVFAYGVWIGLGTLGITDVASLLPSLQTEPTPVSGVAAVPQEQATPTVALTPTTVPTATLAPTDTPPPTPSPTPEALKVEERIVRVTNQYGVNARREPSTESELIEILPQNSEYLLTEVRDDGWMQIALPSTELAWIASEFVESRSEMVLLEVANQRRAALGLPLLDSAVAQAPPANVPATGTTATVTETQTTTEVSPVAPTQPVTDTQPVTATQPSTDAVVLAEPATPTVSVAVTGTINITAGLNARSAPTTTAQLLTLLNGGTIVPILGRSADGEWLQTRLEDGTEAWLFAQYVDVSAPVTAAPVATPGVLPPTPAPSAPVATATSVPAPVEQPAQGVSATVQSLSGANARLAPDRGADSFAVIPYDVVLTVRGRTANNEWLQVEYEEQTVWVLVSTVSLSADLASLPVVTP